MIFSNALKTKFQAIIAHYGQDTFGQSVYEADTLEQLRLDVQEGEQYGDFEGVVADLGDDPMFWEGDLSAAFEDEMDFRVHIVERPEIQVS